MNQSDPYRCDKCRQDFFNPHQVISIPLDPQGFRMSGIYCSFECATWHNRHVNGHGTRMVVGWEQREQWMMDMEKKKKLFDPTVEKKK